MSSPNVDNYCNGKDNRYIVKQDNNWFNPYKWEQLIEWVSSSEVISEDIFIDLPEEHNPIPHMERIPCVYDRVLFESYTSFKVIVDLKDNMTIKSLRIWDQYYSTQDFKDFTDSDIGKLLFTINGNIENLIIDNNMICKDKTGCVCGNEEPTIMQKVCNYVQKYGCPSLECSDPIKPVGHCCPICASMLTISYKNDFSIDLITGITTAYLNHKEYSTIKSYLHKLKSRKFQFIVTDLANKGLADKLVNSIKQYFNDGIELCYY
ncbi:protein amnionless-like [Oppia nitens]|uniref:protein amnionless-like n=1 Tax=Oppia nitens TaxID=1686743 RepID=UPI0023DC9802|nr:protein amnionless-like [Oppia nitens]